MNGYDIILLHADLQWRHVHVHQRLSLSNTMEEPPIKDPLRKGQTLYKGHIFPKRNFRMEQTNFKLPKRGQLPYKARNYWPQSVLYLELRVQN